MSVRHFFDHRSKPLQKQPKNSVTFPAAPALPLGGIVEDGASRAALEAAPGLVIQIGKERRSNATKDFLRRSPGSSQGRSLGVLPAQLMRN
jgi:hypothetical protein